MREGVAGDLTEVEQRLAQWRKGAGGRGSRIPAELWSAAATVARRRGVYRTARALRLNYEGLKSRVVAEAGDGVGNEGTRAGFVEVQVGSPTVGGALVELVGPGGEQMRIHLGGVRSAELVALAQTFWSRQS